MVATRSKIAVQQQEAPLTHVLDRLRGSRPYSRGYTAHCPGSVHRNGDSKPSLMIWETEEGSVGLKCFAGCTRKDICTSLGITEQDLYPRNDKYRPKHVARSLDLADLCLDKHIDPRLLRTLGVVDGYTWQTPKGKRCKNVVRIPYHNLDGSEYSRAHLRLTVKGHGPWEGTGDLIPYGLDRLKDATDSLVIVEGESDCWTLWQWNIPALGIPGASNAQALRAEHIEHFPKRVYIVKENPPAGPKFVKSIATKLHTCGYQGEILQLDLQASHQLEDPNDLNKLLFEENRPKDFLTEWQKVLDAALLLDPATLASPSSKRKRSAGSQPPEDSGSDVTEEESEYIELVEGYYCTEERDKLYKQVIEKDPETHSIIDTRFDPVRLQRAGMPRLLDVYNVEGKSDGYLSDETFYHIEWSGRQQQGPHWFTENELNRGEWFSKFPGIPATKRSTRDHYADVVKSQVDAFRLPVGLARRSTGWHKTGERWEYYWRDGRSTLDGPVIPIYGYDFASHTTHQTAWLHHMTAFPRRPDPERVTAFRDWLDAASPQGHMTLLNTFAYRSLLTSHIPNEMAVLAVADDSLAMNDGSSGSGKTTSTDFARGVDGPCPYRAEPDCKFNGTPSGIETRLTPLHDLLATVTDIHFNGDPTDKQKEDYLTKLDKFISSTADNGEMKERSNKNVTAKAGARVKCGLVFDGEKMAPVHLSRLRRMALLQYRRGCIDTDKVHGEWTENQAVHTAIGHAIIGYAHSQFNTDYAAFCTQVRVQEAEYTQRLFTDFMGSHAGFDENIARSLAANFARFVTGAWLAEIATGAIGLVETTSGYALSHMNAFAGLIENGGPAQIDREWVIDTTKRLLAYGQAHGLDMHEQPLDYNLHGILQTHGYKRTLQVDTPWQVSGVYLYNLSDDGRDYWFHPEMWMELLKAEARKEHKTWTLSKQTFSTTMVRMGIAIPDEGGRSSGRPYIAGKRLRRLHLTDALFNSSIEDEKIAVPATATVPINHKPSLQADEEQDRPMGPLSQPENSGPVERSQNNAPPSGFTSQSVKDGTAGTAGTAHSDTFIESDIVISEETEQKSQQYDLAQKLFTDLWVCGQQLTYLENGQRDFESLDGHKLSKEDRHRFIRQVQEIDPQRLREAWEEDESLVDPRQTDLERDTSSDSDEWEEGSV